ncbi:UpxY family transcription antiterminator [Labilibaculum sp. A4]|uniref:UpxY family transcription antiterminator n=1 Tax=Labilibaculum euxinus TaxID=2686357 RepID=UPI000F62208F|nr:UpxY family transcription antiterminator [Labilibaculum euxinus]MDQ1769227.1 UpxY family transcription antiterminator [Labilibaculum euxinus]MWN74751.1 UpxY family transcription antiterminator [Labilibaculum euxinus]
MQAFKRPYFWHAIYTRSRAEKRLYKELCSKNIECYLPLQKELRQWSDRTKWVEEPLLRSYLFVKVSEREYYNAVNSVFAVRYVTFGGKAVSIPEQQIEALQLFLEDKNRKVDLCSDHLEKGELVEVVAGPLKGIQGEITQIKGKNRIVIRFDSLGTCVYTDISLDTIKQVQPVTH